MANVVSKILDWLGFRVLGAWVAEFINNLWQAAKNALIESVFNTTFAIQVGWTENVEVLAPMLALREQGDKPYTNAPQWDFEEGTEYQLGQRMYLGRPGTQVEGLWIDEVEHESRDESDWPMFIEYPVPSQIIDSGYDEEGTDEEKAAHTHYVLPVREWTQAAGSTSGGTQGSAAGTWACKPKTITYRHNASYIGGGLDGHDWMPITPSGTVVTQGQMVTIPLADSGLEVGQWARVNGTDLGFVSAVDSTTVTLYMLVSGIEASTIEIYKEAV